ncbi:hypothetical protein [Oceanicaulis alexandrii]|uniref:hypothetical protein n=1 Tax=Oceanicaulis alexandrii TaxID=153233 RepID=UPI002352A4E7|nr:hypothetical protein [Oceanicaulis alexandrii]
MENRSENNCREGKYEPHTGDPQSELFFTVADAMQSFYMAKALSEVSEPESLSFALFQRCFSCFFLEYGALWSKSEPYSLQNECKEISEEIDEELEKEGVKESVHSLRDDVLGVRSKFIAHRLNEQKYVPRVEKLFAHSTNLILLDLCALYVVLARHLDVEPYADFLTRLRHRQTTLKAAAL